jgi:hypothetical protein
MNFVMLRKDGIRPGASDIEYTPDDAAHAEANALWDRLNDETNTLVDENWPAIERVANALLDCPLLIGIVCTDASEGVIGEWRKPRYW